MIDFNKPEYGPQGSYTSLPHWLYIVQRPSEQEGQDPEVYAFHTNIHRCNGLAEWFSSIYGCDFEVDYTEDYDTIKELFW